MARYPARPGTEHSTRGTTTSVQKLLIESATLLTLALTASPVAAASTGTFRERSDALYDEIGLEGAIERSTFDAALRRSEQHGVPLRMLAIADMTQPSTAQRLVVIDMQTKKIVMRTWVAHGQNSGELMATRFSNIDESHQTSVGLYRVGQRIVSPKHGPALLLDGLDKGKNDKARSREIIVHGADYVSETFIEKTGRLGRSWGCPAIPRAEMARAIEFLADGGLLYVHGG
jgi:hypothetical protein